MHFLVVCRDVIGSGDARNEHLPDHRAYVDEYAAAIVYSGPLVLDDHRCGQVAVVDVPDLAAAQRFAAEDPFTRAGVFRSVQIDRVAPKFFGGARWEGKVRQDHPAGEL